MSDELVNLLRNAFNDDLKREEETVTVELIFENIRKLVLQIVEEHEQSKWEPAAAYLRTQKFLDLYGDKSSTNTLGTIVKVSKDDTTFNSSFEDIDGGYLGKIRPEPGFYIRVVNPRDSNDLVWAKLNYEITING